MKAKEMLCVRDENPETLLAKEVSTGTHMYDREKEREREKDMVQIHKCVGKKKEEMYDVRFYRLDSIDTAGDGCVDWDTHM